MGIFQLFVQVAGVWESMGFQRIGDTAFWGRNQFHQHPKMKDVCRFIKVAS